MQFITPVYFVSVKNTTDEAGDTNGTEVLRKALASKKSIGTSEFYQAHTAGMKPELKLEVRTFEYQGEKVVLVDDIRYRIIRTFNDSNGKIELTLVGDVHGIT